ncbi:MAG TPA: UDP-glucose 4-epimerase GalE [Blastocatellia bacterium]|jgi:UDP-glucose 4-epimerase|nr:UDP-glucose 4-epimerase GalE [Blastocatellia bacterium]
MRILVTGGAGYIGSVVAERLIEFGHTPVVYDNLSDGHREAVPSGADLVVADLSDREAVIRCLDKYSIEAVIHMAAHALVGESMIDPSKYFRNNVGAGIQLLDAMVERGLKRLVFSSTSAVYGEPEKSPVTESSPQLPTNPYGESKLAFEKVLRWYDRAHGIKYATLRYFNVAGATARSGEQHNPETHLIPLALGCALGRRDAVDIFGNDYPTPDGTCVRDYIHVIDLADAHILALAALEGESKTYNLGNGSGFSVLEVIESARRVTNRPLPTRVAPRRPGDPGVLVANSARARQELGWMPVHSELDTIIESAWKWHISHPGGYESRDDVMGAPSAPEPSEL